MAVTKINQPPQGYASKYDRLIAKAKKVPPATTIVVHPCDETSLRGATEAAQTGIIVPILVGPSERIKSAAQRAQDRYQRDMKSSIRLTAMPRRPKASN